MGLDYAYELIAERASAERLLLALCEHLAPDDRTRLLASLRTGLPGVMENVERLCLSFLFPKDEELAEYSKDSLLPLVDGRVPVGCVWTSIECGDKYVLVRATAATSPMSLLFERSASVRATFNEAGRAGGAVLVSFDDEQGDFLAVWPWQGRFTLSVDAESFVDEQCNLKVDDYCDDLVMSARRTFGR